MFDQDHDSGSDEGDPVTSDDGWALFGSAAEREEEEEEEEEESEEEDEKEQADEAKADAADADYREGVKRGRARTDKMKVDGDPVRCIAASLIIAF